MRRPPSFSHRRPRPRRRRSLSRGARTGAPPPLPPRAARRRRASARAATSAAPSPPRTSPRISTPVRPPSSRLRTSSALRRSEGGPFGRGARREGREVRLGLEDYFLVLLIPFPFASARCADRSAGRQTFSLCAILIFPLVPARDVVGEGREIRGPGAAPRTRSPPPSPNHTNHVAGCTRAHTRAPPLQAGRSPPTAARCARREREGGSGDALNRAARRPPHPRPPPLRLFFSVHVPIRLAQIIVAALPLPFHSKSHPRLVTAGAFTCGRGWGT
jgi:hypothetical protein